MAQFSDCGKHCSDPYCKQQDMLPFDCDTCGKSFCAQHYSYENHNCKGRADKDRRVIVCPLCDKALPLASGVDENLLFEQHSATCVPKPVKAQVPRCPSKGCKEKLTFSNSCNCGSCGVKVCLKHRFEDQHHCQPKSCRSSAGRAGSGLLNQLQRLVK
mmetsp:Transcript_776/g.1737  ORF Transcript_776/g.1737 Transcript_776/m.1737 type:complete len:158 (-) Transcript_776:263-736(-)